MSDANQLPALSEAQLEIMNLFWDASPRSVAEAWEILGGRRGVARNTVHTLITRLEEKGWLRRVGVESPIQYEPTVSRDENQAATVRRMVATVFDGSPEGLVLALLNDHSLTEAEAQRIHAMIAAARGKQP